MIKYFHLPLTLLLFPIFISLLAQSIQFQGEQIEITISDERADMLGMYYFYNPTFYRVTQSLYYPFVVNVQLLYPDSIRVSLAPNNPSFTYRLAQSGIFFSIPFLPE